MASRLFAVPIAPMASSDVLASVNAMPIPAKSKRCLLGSTAAAMPGQS